MPSPPCPDPASKGLRAHQSGSSYMNIIRQNPAFRPSRRVRHTLSHPHIGSFVKPRDKADFLYGIMGSFEGKDSGFTAQLFFVFGPLRSKASGFRVHGLLRVV